MTRKDVANYIGEIALALARMARGVGLRELAYFLDMAALEAANTEAMHSDKQAAGP